MKVVYIILPGLEAYRANKKIRKKLSDDTYEMPNEYQGVSFDDVIEEYNSTLDSIRKFEEKAKSLLIAWTIAITLILNLSDMVYKIVLKIDICWCKWAAIVVAILAVIYMLFAGILVIQVLTKENIKEVATIKQKATKDVKELCIANMRNADRNMIRNNRIYTAYQCIMNSAVCLVILFIARTLIVVT